MSTTVQALNAESVAPSAPVARPKPVVQAEYVAATCPLCFGGLDQRIRGLYCPRCKGWLVAEQRDGAVIHSLWQGSV